MQESPEVMDVVAPTETVSNDASAEKVKKSGPGGKHDVMRTYSPEEAAFVFKMVEQHAPRWTHIAKLVSEEMKQPRTAASVRNYYKRFCASKKIAERDSAIKKLNRCQQCGMIKRGHICKGPTNVEGTAPKGLINTTPATANAATSAAAPAAAASAAPAPAPLPARVVTPPPTNPVSTGGLVLSNPNKALPPLAPAALEVLMPGGGALGVSPGALSTPGPLSLSAFSLLGSPTALAALGLPTPASMPASALMPSSALASATAACFPFGSALPREAEGLLPPGQEDETTDAEGEVREILASQDIGAMPIAAAEVGVN